MSARYPGYNVLAKRDTPSWNEQTRRAVDARLAIEDRPLFLDEREWRTLKALADRVIPQPKDRVIPVPVAALVDRKLHNDQRDGYRHEGMPVLREAWRRGLRALDAEAEARHGMRFDALAPAQADALLGDLAEGRVRAEAAWEGLPPKLFWKGRVLHDLGSAYYGHPTAWNEIGFGGPASPRGYVRMGFNRRDPWEGEEREDAKPRR